jgi:hypothetical protein
MVELDEGNDDDLAPHLARRELPYSVRHNRELQAQTDQMFRRRFESACEAHILARREALDELERVHQALADDWDLDVVGDTRPAAIWQMSGRCIGIARLMLDAMALGYTAEVMHVARALHEASRLSDVLGDTDEPELLRRWLANEYVSPKDVRKAEERYEERVSVAAGKPELGRTATVTRRVHKQHSEAAHHQRRWAQDAVSPILRVMFRGPIDVWERRIGATSAMLLVVDEGITSIGEALHRFHGGQWYGENLTPRLASFAALRAEQPLG